MLEELEIDCGRIPDLLSEEEIKFINNLITDPANLEDPDFWDSNEAMAHAELGGPEFEVGRDEDYHELGSPGIIETLVENILPYECEENSNVMWLTSVIMAEIAQNQAFYEGNKRTAYMVGTLFLIKAQLLQNDEAIYPMLDRELTDRLSDLAIDNTEEDESVGREDFYRYLKERLSG